MSARHRQSALTRQPRIACAINVAIAIASSPPLHADGTGIIAVSTTDAQRGPVAKAMAAAIDTGDSASGAARITEDAVADARAALAAGAVPTASLESFRRVREQIDEGWRAFLRVQPDLAASRLAVARTAAEPLVTLPGGDILYADASLRLGAVLHHLGRTAEAQAVLALSLTLDPDRPITLVEFSPDVVAAIDAVRAQARPLHPVRITTEPPGATLTLDGRDIGVAPLTRDLAIGQHVLVARSPTHEPRAIAVAVDTSTRELSLDLTRDPAAARLAEGALIGLADTGAQELVDATLRYADLDDVIVIAETDRRGGPALLAQRCAGIPARCTVVIEIGFSDPSGRPAATREVWQTLRSADLRYPPSVLADARVTGKKLDSRCKLCRSPILWGGIGLGVAIVTTIVVLSVVDGDRPAPSIMVDPTRF